jgi:hypothetical protein
MRLFLFRALAGLALLNLLAGCGTAGPSSPAPTAVPPTATAAPAPTATAAPTAAAKAEIGQAVPLRIGDQVAIGPVQLTLVAIENDSRCPTSVTCAHAGWADAIVDVTIGGNGQGQVTLTLMGHDNENARSQLRSSGYLVRFVKLEPYPLAPAEIDPAQYVATFIVEAASAGTTYTMVSESSYYAVIVPESDGPIVDPDAEGYWTPTKGDIDPLEARLSDFLRRAAAPRSPDLWQKQASYKRQYTGLIRNGRRLIHANFLCDDMGGRWKHEVVMVMDGGDCFFQLTYDVESTEFGNLQINGEA